MTIRTILLSAAMVDVGSSVSAETACGTRR